VAKAQRGAAIDVPAQPHHAHIGLLGRQLTDTMVEHRSQAPSPPWACRMARVDRAARVAKGQRGAAIDVPARMGLLFHLPPASSAATISKMPLKPLLLLG
jgi:hypothetical protein